MQKNKKTPSYRLYKRTGQAVVTLDGRDFYLGPYDSPSSRAEYDRLLAEWLANGRRIHCYHDSECAPSVVEIIAAYWAHAQSYYVKVGKHTSELGCIKQAIRPLKRLYGDTPVALFGPLALKSVQQAYVHQDLCRNVVNRHTKRIKQMFRWASENELIPASVFHALSTVRGIRHGRGDVRESVPVTPINDTYVEAVRLYVSKQVWAMIELQRLTGMRSGEAVIMRGQDLDTSGKIWLYRPQAHKTSHHGHERAIEIGPRAQETVRQFLRPDVVEYLFSPSDAERERRALLHAARKTPMSCGNRSGTNRKRNPKRLPAQRYTTDSYRRAITRACDLANEKACQLKNVRDGERLVPRWHPHQLRHNYATMIRKKYGIESARILLGHRSAFTTEIYAEVDRMKVREIVSRIG